MNINQPAISNPEAMLNFPNARNAERNTLIDSVIITQGMRILDLQAAGGYLADEIFLRMKGKVQCICVEPTRDLCLRISSKHTVISEPVEAFPSVQDQSIDIVFGLAGLHHSNSHLARMLSRT